MVEGSGEKLVLGQVQSVLQEPIVTWIFTGIAPVGIDCVTVVLPATVKVLLPLFVAVEQFVCHTMYTLAEQLEELFTR